MPFRVHGLSGCHALWPCSTACYFTCVGLHGALYPDILVQVRYSSLHSKLGELRPTLLPGGVHGRFLIHAACFGTCSSFTDMLN